MVEKIMFLSYGNQTKIIFEIIFPRHVLQRAAQYNPQAKYGSPAVFVSKALLYTAMPICLHSIYGCFHYISV